MNHSPPKGSPAASSRAVHPKTQGVDRPRISSQWMPRQRIYMDADDERLQSAMLSMRHARRTARTLSNLGAAACGTGLAALLFILAMSRGGA